MIDNLRDALITNAKLKPEEADDAIQKIKESLAEGKSLIETMTDVFGTNTMYLLSVLGHECHERT